jgi:UDP-N-acetylmuramate dehydrogenase
LRVGGPAEVLARPRSREQLAELLRLCHRHDLPLTVLGGGFNTLVRDEGIRGVVVRLHALRALRAEAGGAIEAEAGVSHRRIARLCAARALAGLEFAAGIPGTVGGWVVMNAGIAEREMKDVVERVDVLLGAEAAPRALARGELLFAYRRLELPAGAIVVGARFGTRPGDAHAIRAGMQALLDQRRRTQPVDQPSCGSVFKNPPGDWAGRLIEAAGLKGEACGGAEISTRHANFIVNRGGATAADVLRLIERARGEVVQRFGVELELEVQVQGGGA